VTAGERPMKVVTRSSDGELDYGKLDRPAVFRRQAVGGETFAHSADGEEVDFLDIPAFLRKQAD